MGQEPQPDVGIVLVVWGFLMAFQPPAESHPEAVAEDPAAASALAFGQGLREEGLPSSLLVGKGL